jgi:hypothetical protein
VRRKSVVVLLVAGPILGVAIAALCLVPHFKQFCGETAVYRIGFGLHACESNDEAADDFACTQDIGGLREALLPRDLTPVSARGPGRTASCHGLHGDPR